MISFVPSKKESEKPDEGHVQYTSTSQRLLCRRLSGSRQPPGFCFQVFFPLRALHTQRSTNISQGRNAAIRVKNILVSVS